MLGSSLSASPTFLVYVNNSKGCSDPTDHKPLNVLMSLLVSHKDKTQKEKQCGVVYCMKCGECAEYIGKTARTLGMRFKEHTEGKHPNPAITEHTSNTGHKYTLAYVKVLVREDCDF